MSEGLLSLRPSPIGHDGTQDFDVREGKPTGRTVGRIYLDISTGGQWFWCLNERAITGCRSRLCADTSKAMQDSPRNSDDQPQV